MDIITQFKKAARKKKPPIKIILPEGEDERILAAASQTVREKIGRPLLVGDKKKITKTAEKLNLTLKGIEIIEPESAKETEIFAEAFSQKEKIAPAVCRNIMSNPLYFGAMATKLGYADAMVAGAVYTSGEVISVCLQTIGLQQNISVASSFFLMQIPGFTGGENGNLIFADASVNIDPTPEELADIAITTAKTASSLFGWQPRIALLSFSTKGSAKHQMVDKITKALAIAQKKAPALNIDGELQADAALRPEVAKKKMKHIGRVAGRANILIFPDLNSGNIAYKLVNILAKADALGPILQGFQKPVSDLSRGVKTEEIVKIISLLVKQAN